MPQTLTEQTVSLSKVLNQEFRLDYCRLWQSLIKGDMKGIERYSRRLSAGDLYPLFACVLTGRSWTSVNAGISQTPVTQSEVIYKHTVTDCVYNGICDQVYNIHYQYVRFHY